MAYDFVRTNVSVGQALSTNANSLPAWSGIPLTMACWFRMKAQTTENQQIFNIIATNFSTQWRLVFADLSTGDPLRFVNFNAGTGINVDGTSTVSLNTWYHGCGVVTSSTDRRVYFNGVLENTVTTSGSNTVDPSYVRIGGGINTATGAVQGFNDSIVAECGIWNVALTAEEIASLAKGMTCDKVRPQSLVFYAPLVRELQDVKGGLTITNNNTATVADHPRVYA
jgi:hypothetical protein